MKKYIYGLLDSCSNTLGDLCLLDRDEIFRDGIVSLLSDLTYPDYLVYDLFGYCFGSVSIDADSDHIPHFEIFDAPKMIVSGGCAEIRAKRKEAREHAELLENY